MTTPNLTTIIIIGYNTRSYLKTCLDSVYCQTTRDIEIIYIDNNSEDNSTEFIVEHYPKVKIVQNNSNTGYAKAANQGIELSQSDYVMILNPDVILEPDYTINSITALIKNPRAAAVCGKIYKYDFDQGKKTNIIDTVGLVAFRSRRFLDNGSGLIDNNQFEKPTEVFGVSGNCAIFRKTALEDAKMGGEYFDHDFYMYKEDVDMCWRLRLFGWTFIYTPDAIAHHKRGTGVKNRLTLKATIEGRVEMDDFQRFDSFKNHHLVILKNELWFTFLRDFFWISSRTFALFLYVFIVEPNRFKMLTEICRQIRPMLKKRKLIMQRKKILPNEIWPWLKGKGLIT